MVFPSTVGFLVAVAAYEAQGVGEAGEELEHVEAGFGDQGVEEGVVLEGDGWGARFVRSREGKRLVRGRGIRWLGSWAGFNTSECFEAIFRALGRVCLSFN